MAKEVLFSENARKKKKKGVEIASSAVRVTIGPFGRNIVLDKTYGSPDVTNDGVTIVKDITLKDKYENMGVSMIKEVANKTNDVVGDGTSTSVILAHELMSEGLKYINRGVNLQSIKAGMKRAKDDILELLDKTKKEITTDEEIIQVATVSAESKEIGKIIADTVKKVGKDGVVTVEESQKLGIESDVVEGLEIEKGYLSPYMMTNTEAMIAEYKDVPVLLTDKKIVSVKEILPLLEKLSSTGKKDLVVVCDSVEGEALTTFVVNKLRGTFNILAIEIPGFGDTKKSNLSDIACTIGATVISEDTGATFDKCDLSVLGQASRVVSKKDKTIIVGTNQTKKSVKDQIELLKEQAKKGDKFEKDKLYDRIAKLSGGVAVLYVGASTETEIKYLKFKIEDAVNATKSAIDEGIVAGGGAALTHIANSMNKNMPTKWDDDYELMGYKIVISALESPLKQIADNALGSGEGIAIVRKVQEEKSEAGYDAIANKIQKNMFDAGIIDPVKVTKQAVLNSISTASVFLTIEGAIADIKEEGDDKQKMPPMGMGGGMPGMY